MQRRKFQSTHPRGMRLLRILLINHQVRFQSTHPRGMRPEVAIQKNIDDVEFQSTHPRGMRHGTCVQSIGPKAISIHASAWDATTENLNFSGYVKISIHASAWDATITRTVKIVGAIISIHASAWDATKVVPIQSFM